MRGLIEEGGVEPITSKLLDDFLTYFKKFDTDVINNDELLFMIKGRSKYFDSPEEAATYKAALAASTKDLPESIAAGIKTVLHEQSYASQLAKDVAAYIKGAEIDLADATQSALTKLKVATRSSDNIMSYCDKDISSILADENDATRGITFRLKALSNSMRPLRGGDFGILAGRVDTGKTSLVCSELTYMAAQVTQPILWLNNEGPSERIYPRLYQAALGITYPEMIELDRQGKLVSSYLEAINSDDPFKIRIKDVHGLNINQVERVIEELEPSIVVYDMLDNIKGFGNMPRTDLVLEELYKHGRDMAVIYDHVGIATSQVSVDGDGMLYPSMHMLKDSKTGKQGASDFIIMSGYNRDAGESIRGIGIPKNKLMRYGAPKDPRCEVLFDAARCRFTDVTDE